MPPEEDCSSHAGCHDTGPPTLCTSSTAACCFRLLLWTNAVSKAFSRYATKPVTVTVLALSSTEWDSLLMARDFKMAGTGVAIDQICRNQLAINSGSFDHRSSARNSLDRSGDRGGAFGRGRGAGRGGGFGRGNNGTRRFSVNRNVFTSNIKPLSCACVQR